MCGIALPTLRPDTLCGRFSMMGKVERHPHIDITYFSLSVIRLSWMCLSWWVFNLLDTQSTENNTFDESFLSYEKYEFWGELFLLNYSICIAYWAADNVFFFFTPWTDVPTLWTAWEALFLWTTRARPPPTPKSGGLMSRPLPSWTLIQAVQVQRK